MLSLLIWQTFTYYSVLENICQEIKEQLKLNMKQVRYCIFKLCLSNKELHKYNTINIIA